MGSVTEERRKGNDKSVFFTESKSALRADIAKIIVFDVISILAYLMFTCWLTVFFSDAGTAVFFTLSAAADVFILYAFIKRARKKYESFTEAFCEMLPSEYDDLCSQAEKSGKLYNTLYLLDEFIYVPQNMLLIPYRDIKKVITEYHKTNGIYDGAKLKITLADKGERVIYMKSIRQFRDEHDDFIWKLEHKSEKNKTEVK